LQIKLLRKIVIAIAAVMGITVAALLIALQNPSLQSRVASGIIKSATKNFDGKVSVGQVCYVFFNDLIIKDFSAITSDNDTLVCCEKLSVSFSAKNLIAGKLRFRSVYLSNGIFKLIIYPDSTNSISRLLGKTGGENIHTDKIEVDKSKVDTTDATVTSEFFPDIRVRNLKIDNMAFSFVNLVKKENGVKREKGIDFSDLEIDNINLEASGIRRDSSDLRANIKELSFDEKSGFRLRKMNSEARFGRRGLTLTNLFLNDGISEIKSEKLSFIYSSLSAFNHFTDSVMIHASLDDSYINLKTIGYFAPSLLTNNLSFRATGILSGSVNNIRTDNLRITSKSGLTFADVKARISGLPIIEETMAFIDIAALTTTTPDIASILNSINPLNKNTFLSKLSPLVKYSFTGRIAGLFTDFVANGDLTSNIGNIYMDVLLRESREEHGLEIEGKLVTDNFNIGELIRNKSLGEITLSSNMSALLRDEQSGGSNFYIDSIRIKKIEFNKYAYSNIYSVGSYVNNRFDGRIICHDPNLDFIFQGVIGHSNKEDSYYDFYADVIHADLAAINFDKRDTVSTVSFRTLANFTRKASGDILGNISVKSLDYSNRNGFFNVGDISIKSLSGTNNYSVSLNSSFADATYTGSDFLTTFLKRITGATLSRHLSFLTDSKETYNESQREHYNLSLNFHDTKAIAQMILPGLKIAEKSALKINISEEGKLEMSYKSAESGFGKNSAEDIVLSLSSDLEQIKGSVRSSGVSVSGIQTGSVGLDLASALNKVSLRGLIRSGKEEKNSFNLSSDINIVLAEEDSSLIYEIRLNPVEFNINSNVWHLPESRITIRDSLYVIEGFAISNGDQHLFADGRISPLQTDTLSLIINKFDISPVNMFLSLPFPVEGRLSGKAAVSEVFGNLKLIMDLKAEEMKISSEEFGNLKILSSWNSKDKNFDISLKNNLGKREPLTVEGKFIPSSKKLDLYGKLDSLNVNYFEPVFEGILSNLSGSLSGNLTLSGPVSELTLSSDNSVANKLGFTVDFTNVPYTVEGPLLLNPQGVTVNNATVTDRFGNRGRVNGGLTYSHFKDMGLNLNMNVRNMECLNTYQTESSAFYGRAFGSGRVSISGPFDKVLLDISLTTNKNTELHIPLQSTSEAANSDLLRFVPFNSQEDERATETKVTEEDSLRKSSSDLMVKFRGNVTPDAALMIEIDKSVGDVITGYGTGLITIDVQPSRDLFNIQGDYIIESGSYKFVLQGLFNRDFTIQEGGNIGFNGDIMKTNLNLTANYRTKASINTLISDTSSVSSRRNVDCLINLTGPLMNPNIGFDIQIPDLDPLTKSRVDAALNTEDKIVKQVMSLLVSGSFIPDIQSSIVNNSTILYSNATEVLSNQINNIFKQLDIPLDLSFNYQPGQNGRDLFDAAVSAQLFDNRVIVNGNIGNSRYLNKGSSVVGDLEVEIKLDEDGRFRAKAFSHSADQYSNYLDNSQRNGIGIVYQEEFSTLSELINSLFMSKTRREQIATERENRLRGRIEAQPAAGQRTNQ